MEPLIFSKINIELLKKEPISDMIILLYQALF